MLKDLCTPAFIYLVFALTGVVSDLIVGAYGEATTKTVVGAIITTLLSVLCKRGLEVVSWVIVMVPFALMTLIIMMLIASGSVTAQGLAPVSSGEVMLDNTNSQRV